MQAIDPLGVCDHAIENPHSLQHELSRRLQQHARARRPHLLGLFEEPDLMSLPRQQQRRSKPCHSATRDGN